MKNQESLFELVNQEIKTLNIIHEPQKLYDPIEYILSLGGKRLRPVLMLMAYNLFSEDVEKALKPAIGIEIFHNFTLLHDDIMDNSWLRRNKPTVHAKWDNNTAILSGDAMSIKAYQYIAQCPSDILQNVLAVFSQTAIEVCEGQQYDMDFETAENVSIPDYLRMIELKTAVLIAASLKIGAIIGGASEKEAQHLYDFGKNIGLAFQLQDDILDVFGNTEVFGKKTGGDIVANKKTYLLLKALELSTEGMHSELQELISSKDFIPEQKIEAVTNIYHKLKVKQLAENQMNLYFDKALSCLNKVNVNNDKKIVLKNYAENLMVRVN